MATTITRQNLTERCVNLNRRMKEAGSSVHYQVQGRNGGFGLDRYEHLHCLSMVTFGTKREVGEFMHAMMVALDDVKLYRKEG